MNYYFRNINLRQMLSTIFSSFAYENFRYYWIGQCIAQIGLWMQRTALIWLVYNLTNSPFMVGLLGVCQFVPMFLLTLPAGAIVDHVSSKRRLLFTTNFFFILQALILTLLTYNNTINYIHIFILTFFYGVLVTFDMPTRLAYLPDFVGPNHIINAISLNSSLFNLAKIIGPAIAGVIMIKFGIIYCFIINTICYIAVTISLFLIHTPVSHHTHNNFNILQEMSDGLKYIWHNNTLKINTLLLATVITFSMNNDIISPIFAKEVLNRGSEAYSMLMSTTGLGAFLGAIYMSYRSIHGINKKLYLLSIFFMTGIQISLFFIRNYAYALMATLVIGFYMIVFLNMGNSIFQIVADAKYRGRVMSVYSFLNGGSATVGSLYAGVVMEHLGGAYGWPGCGTMALFILGIVFLVYRPIFISWYSKQ